VQFVVRPADVEEQKRPGEPARVYVERLARAKAEAVSAETTEIVLAADTVVVLDDEVLEKPLDEADAARMLRQLSGREHVVMTGVCLRSAGTITVETESTRVRFLPLSEDEIREYVASGEPMDKAGAYAIQGLASKFIDRVEGCYFNVVGLPIARVCGRLKEAGYVGPQ
jgi:septum formation protein